MGDGRYYTAPQFLSVIYLTIAIVYMTINIMQNYFKLTQNRRLLLITGGTLVATLIALFSEQIVVSYQAKAIFHFIKNGCLTLHIITIAVIYYHSIRDVIDHHYATLSILILTLIASIFFPIVSNIYLVGYIVHYSLCSQHFTTYQLSNTMFSRVKKSLLDYVLIVNLDGHIIFKNDKVNDNALFTDQERVDINQIDSFFKTDAQLIEIYDKSVLKIGHQTSAYLQYRIKKLYDKQAIIGYMISFEDVSPLIKRLDTLQKNKLAITRKNHQLTSYKEDVYQLERNRQINQLLDDILNEQRSALQALSVGIDQLDCNKTSFVSDITHLITIAKRNLKNVRRAVHIYLNPTDEENVQ